MNLKRTFQVQRLLTSNGASDHVRVATGSPFLVGQTVNLTSGGPSITGLQISDIKGVVGSTDIALYLTHPVNGQPFDATGYTIAQSATVIAPTQTLWYSVGSDADAPTDVFTDLQMNDIMAAILPGGATLVSNVAVTNFPASQPVSVISLPLPTGAATEVTLASILSAVTGTLTTIVSGTVATSDVGSTTGTVTSIAVNLASVTFLAANPSRMGACVYNRSTGKLYLKLGAGPASVTDFTVLLVADAYYEVPNKYQGAISGIWDGGSGSAYCTELT